MECWLPLFKKLNFHLLSLRQVSTPPYCAQKGFLDKLNGQLLGRVENATKGRGLLLFYPQRMKRVQRSVILQRIFLSSNRVIEIKIKLN